MAVKAQDKLVPRPEAEAAEEPSTTKRGGRAATTRRDGKAASAKPGRSAKASAKSKQRETPAKATASKPVPPSVNLEDPKVLARREGLSQALPAAMGAINTLDSVAFVLLEKLPVMLDDELDAAFEGTYQLEQYSFIIRGAILEEKRSRQEKLSGGRGKTDDADKGLRAVAREMAARFGKSALTLEEDARIFRNFKKQLTAGVSKEVQRKALPAPTADTTDETGQSVIDAELVPEDAEANPYSAAATEAGEADADELAPDASIGERGDEASREMEVAETQALARPAPQQPPAILGREFYRVALRAGDKMNDALKLAHRKIGTGERYTTDMFVADVRELVGGKSEPEVAKGYHLHVILDEPSHEALKKLTITLGGDQTDVVRRVLREAAGNWDEA